jgi:hypothetical protein
LILSASDGAKAGILRPSMEIFSASNRRISTVLIGIIVVVVAFHPIQEDTFLEMAKLLVRDERFVRLVAARNI